MKNSRSLLALLVAVAIVGIAVGARVLVWGGAAPSGGFTLQDGAGRVVTEHSFPGQWPILYFGYTFCPDVCPTSLSVLTLALDQLPDSLRGRVVPIFITVDPLRDTPEVVDAYVRSFDSGILGLSGRPDAVAAAAKAYGVHVRSVPNDDPKTYTVDHTSLFFVLGPDGTLVRTLKAHDSTPDALAGQLADLLK